MSITEHSTNFENLLSLFDQAIKLPKEEQIPFIERNCYGNKELLQECKSLLDNQQSDDSFFNQLYGPQNGEQEKNVVGQHFGVYQIKKKIGSGGMADVYLANRTDGVHDSDVALKLIQSKRSTESFIKRFHSERKILASLNHPNIAHLIDGGSTEEELPYLVMEYIDGKRIDRYCQELSLSIKDKLTLFIKVCSAVSYAHQNLVIHRDLKPNNIIIDKHGQPKLLDFGLAKLVDSRSMQNLTYTEIAMTPNYASPEQLKGEALTTSSDIFSLGILLYELLTDKHPYENNLALAFQHTLKTRNSTIVPPSKAILKNEKHTSPGYSEYETKLSEEQAFKKSIKLSQAIKGDLDSIVLKMLRVEPEKRYSTVQAIVDDIERHLYLMPVLARKDTFWYHTNRFIRRNSAVISMLCIAIAISLSAIGYQQIRILKERDIAEQKRDIAMQTQELMTRLFEISDPDKARGESITAREILDQGAINISKDQNTHPEVKSALMHTIGTVYRQLGLYDRAVPLLEDALAIRQQNTFQDKTDIADTYSALARLHELQGKLSLAEKFHKSALKIYHGSIPGENLKTAFNYNGLGAIYAQNRQYEKAIEYLEKALRIRLEHLGSNHPKITNMYNNLGLTYSRLQQYERSIEYHHKSAKIILNNSGENNSNAVLNYNNLAVAYQEKGDYENALRYSRRALAIGKQIFEGDHPITAEVYINMGITYRKLNQHELASRYNNMALMSFLKIFGPEHSKTILSYANFSGIYRDIREYDKSIEYAKKGIETGLRALGKYHPFVGLSYNNLGEVYNDQGLYDLAITHFENAIHVWHAAYDRPHTNLSLAYHNLGISYYKKQDYVRAINHLEKAYNIRLQILGPKHPDSMKSKNAIYIATAKPER